MIKLFLENLIEKGWTQIVVAEKTGVQQSGVSKLLNGGECSLKTAIKIANSFNVTIDEILGRSEPKETITPTEKKLLETTAGNYEITRAALRSAQGEKLMQEMKKEGRQERKNTA